MERFKSVDFMSCTCDLWSRGDRSFIAMKSHYIDEKTGLLVSDLLALKRIHSKDHITVKLAMVSIMEEYGISKKTSAITTDNAGEFCCAFKKFSENYVQFKEPCDTIEFGLGDDVDDDFLRSVYLTRQSVLADGDDEDEDDHDDEIEDCEVIRGTELRTTDRNIMPMANDVENRACTHSSACEVAETDKFVLHDLESIFRSELHESESDAGNETVDDSDAHFPLPNRSICNAHTLSLIGKNDLFEALSNEDFANQYFETFEKVNKLWNAANKTKANVKIVKQWIGKKIRPPHKLRWNRIYDAVCFQLVIYKLFIIIYVKC